MAKDEKPNYRASLAIDPDRLDDCLVEQPELYSHVAEAYAIAVSVRDEAKLELEEAAADLDRQLRIAAVKKEERVTDKTIEKWITTMPKIKELTRKFLDTKKEADLWGALEKSYNQRLSALKELVGLRVREMHSIAVRSGAGEARSSLRDAEAARAQNLRRDVMRGRRDG